MGIKALYEDKLKRETQLIEWNRIRADIAEVTARDIALFSKEDAVSMGKMNYSLEAVKEWAKQSGQKLEVQNEIAESRLYLNRKQGEYIEANIPEEGGNPQLAQNGQLQVTLTQIGIADHDSPKFRFLARLPLPKFTKFITEKKTAKEELTCTAMYHLRDNLATKWTGDQESYTPETYIEAARSVMGSIDCDPASNEIAQKIVQAKVYFTPENDGLSQPWLGNIFLNPPYSHPDVANFVNKLIDELIDGQQAILLTNNNTDTAFFHKAACKASALCFTKGRISFYKADGETKTSPTNGQVFFYFGNNKKHFVDIFSEFGLLMETV